MSFRNSKESNNNVYIPNAKGLRKIFGSSGYSFELCLMEFIDNSMDCDAKNITVYLHLDPQDTSLQSISVEDDGNGMNFQLLQNAIAFAKSNKNQCDNNIIGCFGIGMKSAAITLATQLFIISKQQNEYVYCLCDWQQMDQNNSFAPTLIGYKQNPDDIEHCVIRKYAQKLQNNTNGTIISLTDITNTFRCITTNESYNLKFQLEEHYKNLNEYNLYLKANIDKFDYKEKLQTYNALYTNPKNKGYFYIDKTKIMVFTNNNNKLQIVEDISTSNHIRKEYYCTKPKNKETTTIQIQSRNIDKNKYKYLKYNKIKQTTKTNGTQYRYVCTPYGKNDFQSSQIKGTIDLKFVYLRNAIKNMDIKKSKAPRNRRYGFSVIRNNRQIQTCNDWNINTINEAYGLQWKSEIKFDSKLDDIMNLTFKKNVDNLPNHKIVETIIGITLLQQWKVIDHTRRTISENQKKMTNKTGIKNLQKYTEKERQNLQYIENVFNWKHCEDDDPLFQKYTEWKNAFVNKLENNSMYVKDSVSKPKILKNVNDDNNHNNIITKYGDKKQLTKKLFVNNNSKPVELYNHHLQKFEYSDGNDVISNQIQIVSKSISTHTPKQKEPKENNEQQQQHTKKKTTNFNNNNNNTKITSMITTNQKYNDNEEINREQALEIIRNYGAVILEDTLNGDDIKSKQQVFDVICNWLKESTNICTLQELN